MDIKRGILIAGVIGSFVVGANACTDPSQPEQADPPAVVRVLGVKVTPQTVVLAIGETKQVLATVGPADATDKAVTWESTDSSVATVNASGLVTGKAEGAGVFITAVTHDGQRQSSANVTVVP